MRIALLEDDSDQALLVKSWIENEEFDCFIFTNGKALLRELNRESFDLIILDWMVPDMDGIEVLKWIRSQTDWIVPILFVTAKDEEADIITALNAGADDYMVKPATKGELLARIHALSRRSKNPHEENNDWILAPYIINNSAKTIILNGESISLTLKEFELAYFMFKNIGRVISRNHILKNVWGTSSDLNTRTVDTHISRVRSKLQLKPENGWTLRSIYQHGYRLEQYEQ